MTEISESRDSQFNVSGKLGDDVQLMIKLSVFHRPARNSVYPLKMLRAGISTSFFVDAV